jgi:ArsR family metal-binding transcriptional regulator
MDAIKLLSSCSPPANCNRRGEFEIYSMAIKYQNYDRRDDCEWCGVDGEYYHKKRNNS